MNFFLWLAISVGMYNFAFSEELTFSFLNSGDYSGSGDDEDTTIETLTFCRSRTLTINGEDYSFPEVWNGELSFSAETCPNTKRAKASIKCVEFLFQPSTLVDVSCDKNLKGFIDDVKKISVFNETTFNMLVGNIRVLLSPSNASDIVAEDEIVAVIERAEQQLETIIPPTWSNAVSLVGSLTANEEEDAVKTVRIIESLSSKVIVPDEDDSIAVESDQLAARVYRRSFSATNRVKRQSGLEISDGFEDEITVRLSRSNRTEKAASFFIPRDAFLQAANSASNFSGQFFVVYFKNRSKFPSNENTSQPISISFGTNITVSALGTPLVVNFSNNMNRYERITNPSNNRQVIRTELGCRFWNFSLNQWSSSGCCLNQSEFPPVCQCNHLTNFALLVSQSKLPNDVALEIVSNVGCSLSIVGLFITILIHLLNPDRIKKKQTQIFVNLCFNLMNSYIIFVTGVENVGSGAFCTVITALLQYFFLVSWCWMSIYSYDLYLSLVKVFRETFSNTFLKRAYILSYGFPFVVVLLNASITVGYLDLKGTDVTCNGEKVLASSLYRADHMCWLHGDSLYFGFLLPVGIMLVINTILLVVIFRKVVWKKETIVSTAAKLSASQRLLISITLFVTMGLAWIPGYFMLLSEDSTYLLVTSWIFAIFAATQGFGIFLMSCVRNNNINRECSDIWSLFSNRVRSLCCSVEKDSYDLTVDPSKESNVGTVETRDL